MMKATVRTQPTGHRYQVKIWQEGQPESSAVFLLNTTRPLSEMAAGSALLVAHLADVTFGDITMINLAEAAGPAITNVQSQPGLNAATIEWVTSEPATGLVEYGLTSGYERGSVSLSEFATNHSVMLSGLAADTLYHFRIVASNAAGYTSSTGDLTFRTNASTSFRSDDFNGPGLDTSLWTLVDPVGDSTLSFDGAHALLGVPAGVDHSVWRSGNKSARLMQPAADEDLGVEVKFDSQPSGVYAQQGLIIEQDGGNFLRFDFYSSAMGLNLFAGSFVNGAPTKRLNTRIAGGTTLYMRVERQADVWALQYSYNGQAWTQAVSFTHVLNVSRVGVFVGNEGASPPAHTARIDHFFNTAAPIMPHD
jgi:regulation of enolase protein 1 (concanavalin A-like superfamily)